MEFDLTTNLMVFTILWLLIKFILYPYVAGLFELLFRNKYTFIVFGIFVALAIWKPDTFIPIYEDILLWVAQIISEGYTALYDFSKDILHNTLYKD